MGVLWCDVAGGEVRFLSVFFLAIVGEDLAAAGRVPQLMR